MVMYEVLSGTVPYDDPTPGTVPGTSGHLLSHSYALIASGRRPLLPAGLREDESTQWISAMLHRSWEFDPSQTASTAELISTLENHLSYNSNYGGSTRESAAGSISQPDV